jgi:hypothetical protein
MGIGWNCQLRGYVTLSETIGYQLSTGTNFFQLTLIVMCLDKNLKGQSGIRLRQPQISSDQVF